MTAIRKLVGNFNEAGIDDEVILMRLDNGELLSLEGTAAATWRLIDGSRDITSLAAALADEYDAGHDVIINDVRGLLSKLREAGLIGEY